LDRILYLLGTGNVIKLVLSIIYVFFYYARVFVRITCKSLSGTSTLV
jgi:hypothetical protein